MNKNQKEKEELKEEIDEYEQDMKYLGNLTIEQKKKRMNKIKSFFGFIEYDWGDERPGAEADWKTGAKQW